MKTTTLDKLEKDSNFKKKYVSRFFWFTQAAIYPPSLIIFGGLFGLVYLLNYDLLLTYYAIPFLILLVLGSIWLKSVKRYILKNLFSENDSFLIAWTKAAYEEENIFWCVFTTSNRRHDKYFPETLRKELVKDDFFVSEEFSENKNEAKTKAVSLSEEITGYKDIYICAFKKFDILKNNALWNPDSNFHILFIGPEDVQIIKKKDIDI